MTQAHLLKTSGLDAGYAEASVIAGLNLTLAPGQITAIVGPNGCGKSTCLKSLARLLKPRRGQVLLDGKAIHRLPTRALAQVLGLLPQSPLAPEGITVADLVGRGRTPHHGMMGRWGAADDAAVARALEASDLADLADRAVDELSGGQRQRCWIAMALAQEPEILLLDEPTTYLDIVHQLDVLDLLQQLNRREGTTMALVLHDLNMAARYADRIVAMAGGQVIVEGTPEQVITPDNLRVVFGLEAQVLPDPVSGRPLLIPVGRAGG
ncbi:ABC transporter ATP-binding protein [Pseudooceanicola aestuarii]|uniref:ABC transporter ATP-binding protein n=1 Tax=Pseudooceanicola aestuarii TaxID=2697319 RepID=UPI0013D1D7C7|nr:ABC transporter ATP-binding protein [Pseudooceanicola aestuarii]